MLKALLLPLLSLALAATATAQNLVPNGSFEEPASCVGTPWTVSLELATPWYSANIATPDLYTMENSSACGEYMNPAEPWYYREAYDGNRFAGFYAFINLSTSKDYCAVPVGPLLAGHAYRLTFRYRAHSYFRYAVSRLGALFTEDQVIGNTGGELMETPQINFEGEPFLDISDDWGGLQGDFVAQGGEAFLTIGSFEPSAQVEIVEISGTSTHSAYYLLDAVELIDLTVSVPELGSISNAVTWNADGTIRWNGNGAIAEVAVFDPLGRIVYLSSPQCREVLVNINEAGLYVVRVVVDGRTYSQRFIRE